MESNTRRDEPQAPLAERAKARIARMNRTAAAVTQELGLPNTAKFDVLATVHGDAGSKPMAEQPPSVQPNAGRTTE